MPLDIRSWLEAEGFARYADLFDSHQVDGDALPLLTDANLREMGLAIGPRVKLLAAIARLSGGAAPAPERRRLTVMFVDLVGSTALATRHDPEQLRDLIREYQQAITAQAARFEAHVARYMGDGALVYFGYPKAHEDDAERAVRAALATVRAVASLRSPDGAPLAVHVGIATGLVVVGDVLGAGAAMERAVLGETPNVAARLQALAAPGEVVVSEGTRALTGALFEWQDLGPQSVKGVPEPVRAYRAIAERPVGTRFEARNDSRLTAMVGREAELAMLARRWEACAHGHGQVVLVQGEAGIGKSRLLRALQDSIAGTPHLRITNQCSPYHTDSPLHPMIQQLARAAGIHGSQSRDEQLDRLEAILAGGERIEAALIASLLGIDGSERYGKFVLSPEQHRARTFEALLAQLVRSSRRAPILWVLEDAHWIDPTTLELLSLCIDRVADAAVLAVITFRPDFKHELGRAGHVTRLPLARLARHDVREMVRDVAHGKAMPETLMAEIAAKADGVPLFVEELTKTVLEAGILREVGNAFVMDNAPRGLSVPASLHDSMMARLDRHASLKEVAQAAACIGREFGDDLLGTICGMPVQTLRDGLARLEEAQLVFRRPGAGETQYVFKHALVRDAAYESLLISRRQEIHARIVGALEASRGASPELIAQHASAAGLHEKAIDCWQRAGILAMARPAYQEATSHITQALLLVERMEPTRAWQERRLQLLLLLGQATIPLRGYSHSETVAAFVRAQQVADAVGEAPHRFSILAAMWVAYYVRGDHDRALNLAWQMHRHAQLDRSDGRMLTALRALAIGQMITGELRQAEETFAGAQKLCYVIRGQSREHRLAVAHRFAADPDIATQFHVALTAWGLGHAAQARKLAIDAVAAARSMGHVHTLGHALVHGAIVAVAMRDVGEALRLAEESIAFADEHEMDLWRGYGSALHACALMLSGDAARAVPAMQRGLQHLERTQTGTMVPLYRAVHACALATLGRLPEAAAQAALAQREVDSGHERYWWCDLLRWLGDYRALLPDARPDAEEAYLRALSIARAQQASSFELGAATSLARCWAKRGEPGRADALLAPMIARWHGDPAAPVAQDAATVVAACRSGAPA